MNNQWPTMIERVEASLAMSLELLERQEAEMTAETAGQTSSGEFLQRIEARLEKFADSLANAGKAAASAHQELEAAERDLRGWTLATKQVQAVAVPKRY